MFGRVGPAKNKIDHYAAGRFIAKPYSGTLEPFAASFPNTFQRSLQAASHVSYKK